MEDAASSSSPNVVSFLHDGEVSEYSGNYEFDPLQRVFTSELIAKIRSLGSLLPQSVMEQFDLDVIGKLNSDEDLNASERKVILILRWLLKTRIQSLSLRTQASYLNKIDELIASIVIADKQDVFSLRIISTLLFVYALGRTMYQTIDRCEPHIPALVAHPKADECLLHVEMTFLTNMFNRLLTLNECLKLIREIDETEDAVEELGRCRHIAEYLFAHIEWSRRTFLDLREMKVESSSSKAFNEALAWPVQQLRELHTACSSRNKFTMDVTLVQNEREFQSDQRILSERLDSLGDKLRKISRAYRGDAGLTLFSGEQPEDSVTLLKREVAQLSRMKPKNVEEVIAILISLLKRLVNLSNEKCVEYFQQNFDESTWVAKRKDYLKTPLQKILVEEVSALTLRSSVCYTSQLLQAAILTSRTPSINVPDYIPQLLMKLDPQVFVTFINDSKEDLSASGSGSPRQVST